MCLFVCLFFFFFFWLCNLMLFRFRVYMGDHTIRGTTCDHTISGTTYLTYGSYYTNRGECEGNAITSLN